MLASGLSGKPNSFINSDVALDGEPVIGSFTVDGLTYAVIDESTIELVGVVPSVILSEGSEAAGVEESNESNASEAGVASLPETVTYANITYTLASIAPYAFYLSGVTDVTLPASVSDVDDRAFRSSDVANVSVAEGNQGYSSFDGALYSADKTRLLLIPEGRVGAVLLPREAEVADPGKFSHCSLVDAISVEDGAAFASENGLLYTSDLATLLRVPAGATEATIREGCTTIAAGALEACAKLTTINAPATITSISPDVFHAIPTVSLPAASVILSEGAESPEVEGSNEGQADEASTQLTAMVALASTDDDLPEVDPASVQVALPEGAGVSLWSAMGFSVCPGNRAAADAALGSAAIYAACNVVTLDGNGATTPGTRVIYTDGRANGDGWYSDSSLRNKIRQITVPQRNGYVFGGYWGYSDYAKRDMIIIGPSGYLSNGDGHILSNRVLTAIWHYTVAFDVGESGIAGIPDIAATLGSEVELPNPVRENYSFQGWDTMPDGSGTRYQGSALDIPTGADARVVLYAQWRPNDQDLSFDTSSEPGDEDYPGADKPDQTIAGEQVEAGEKVEIEDPKRPGYVFQGWIIPNAGGTEAIDQDLVYQDETDGKWYVDASKLPDYAGEDGRVELTARWTSVISVDVPSSVTFYADVVTQGNESREGLASSAFGQSKVQSQSEVDLRIVGLESKQVKGNGSTSLGASDILKKKDGSTVSGTDDKLFSLYPATGELQEDDLKDPDATSASKPEGAVDFSLDDILLERSFAADEFTIPAGGTLSLGYRLNLQETATELDYDKLSTLSEGASASIANISYCFAAGHMHGSATGSSSEDIYIEYGGKVYGTADIVGAAGCISELGMASPCYALYNQIMHDQGIPSKGLLPSDAKAKIYARYTGSAATANQPNCKRAGYVRLLMVGLNHDAVELSVAPSSAFDFDSQVAKRAGITFQFMDALFDGLPMNQEGATTDGGWRESEMRTVTLSKSGDIASHLAVYPFVKEVYKFSNKLGGGDQGAGGSDASYVDVIGVTSDKLFLPSFAELSGGYISSSNLWLNHEGAHYSYWKDLCGVRSGISSFGGNVNWGTAIKLGADGAARQWWTRLARIEANGFCYVLDNATSSGTGWGHIDHRTKLAIAPAFCL